MFHVKHSRREMKKELRKKIQIVRRCINGERPCLTINGLIFDKTNFSFELTNYGIWLRDRYNDRIMMFIGYPDIKEIILKDNIITFEKRA